MTRESPDFDELYGAGAETADGMAIAYDAVVCVGQELSTALRDLLAANEASDGTTTTFRVIQLAEQAARVALALADKHLNVVIS